MIRPLKWAHKPFCFAHCRMHCEGSIFHRWVGGQQSAKMQVLAYLMCIFVAPSNARIVFIDWITKHVSGGHQQTRSADEKAGANAANLFITVIPGHDRRDALPN